MASDAANLYATLSRAHWHQRLSRTVLGAVGLLTGALSFICVVFLADNLLNLAPATRLVLLAVFLAGCAATLLIALKRVWLPRLNRRRMAVRLERLHGIADNSLINAVHFDADASLTAELRALFMGHAAAHCGRLRPGRLWEGRRLKRLSVALLGALLVSGAYLVFFGAHARNALIRYLNPSTALAPLNYTQFTVSPGDVRLVEGSDCLISAEARKFGKPVRDLKVLLKSRQGAVLYPMKSVAQSARFQLRDLRESTKYRIAHGNDVSAWYKISVVPRPRIDRLVITITPPAYTGMEPRELSELKRETTVLSGSTITVRAEAAGDLRLSFFRDGAVLPAPGNQCETVLDQPLTLSLDVEDSRGFTHPQAWYCRFQPLPDKPPRVRFLNRELNRQLGIGQTIPLQIQAADDYGVTRLALFLLDKKSEKEIKSYRFVQRKTQREELYVLPIDEATFALNASYQVVARVWDNHDPPNEGRTLAPFTIHVIDLAKETVDVDADDVYERLFKLLSQALEQQKALQSQFSGRIRVYLNRRQLPVLAKRQSTVHRTIGQAQSAATDLAKDNKPATRKLAAVVTALNAKLSQPLMDKIRQLPTVKEDKDLLAALNEVVFGQAEIIKVLQRLLGEINRERLEEQMAEQRLEEEEQDQKLLDKLEKLKENLKSFAEEQKKLAAETEEIDKKEPEDWTMEEEELLGDLAARETELANFFKAAFNDLSKLQNQDFSSSMMAEELVELYEELQKAGEALEGKKTEIATSAENMGVELAESIETNIERWLADQKDSIKWVGEESGESPDVPLQDLPEELTDIVGDLIDSVEDMTDVEDSSNSYLGSFDEGIGWGVSDGNLNDMSAKGVTGNLMPNDSEVQGRSGEGRTGKSSGQFVEEEATGKGGRDTPTRLTASPFEEGTVKDTSKDPQGGATGGGKQSGVGDIGLRGQTPENQPDLDNRLPGNRAELKQKAEALLRELTVHNLPTGDLEDAMAQMALLSNKREDRPGMRFKEIKSDIISSLQDARTTLELSLNSGTEQSRKRRELSRATKYESREGIPFGYERSVQAYFRALADGAGD